MRHCKKPSKIPKTSPKNPINTPMAMEVLHLDEQREVTTAALALCAMKNQNPEDSCNNSPEKSDDNNSPEFPPVLEGLAEMHSEPYEKQLTASDVKDNQCRLIISKSFIKTYILPMLLQEEQQSVSKGLRVTTYDEEGNEYEMVFKHWSSKCYVLTTGWKGFYSYHGLKENQDFITLWMFRHKKTRKPCFLICSRRLPAVKEQLNKRRRRR